MYSRDFGGIQSEGQLYRMEQEYNQRAREEQCSPPPPPPAANNCEKSGEDCHKRGLGLDFLRGLQLDDLILIAIGILLLLDGENETDILIFLIAFLVFF